jgi:hypothetical protein
VDVLLEELGEQAFTEGPPVIVALNTSWRPDQCRAATKVLGLDSRNPPIFYSLSHTDIPGALLQQALSPDVGLVGWKCR